MGAVPRKVGKHVKVKFCDCVGSPSPAASLTCFPGQSETVSFELESGLAKAGNERQRFLLRGLFGFDVLPKHGLAVRSGEDQ
jgi:hypothetical protein